MKKKLIAWLLVICMAISLLPAAALADTAATEQTPSVMSVKSVGDIYVDNLAYPKLGQKLDYGFDITTTPESALITEGEKAPIIEWYAFNDYTGAYELVSDTDYVCNARAYKLRISVYFDEQYQADSSTEYWLYSEAMTNREGWKGVEYLEGNGVRFGYTFHISHDSAHTISTVNYTNMPSTYGIGDKVADFTPGTLKGVGEYFWYIAKLDSNEDVVGMYVAKDQEATMLKAMPDLTSSDIADARKSFGTTFEAGYYYLLYNYQIIPVEYQFDMYVTVNVTYRNGKTGKITFEGQPFDEDIEKLAVSTSLVAVGLNPVPALKITTSAGHPKLSWNTVPGAAKYWIYRSTDGKTFKYYDSTKSTSYTNNSTNIGTTYYYKIKAVDSSGTTDYSAVKSIKCTPAAPSLSISRVNGKPKLSWKAVSGATKYWIYRSTDGKNFKYYDSTTKTGYTNSGAASGTKYYYKVKAVAVVNGKNVASSYSYAKSMVCTPATPNVSITSANGKPKLSWNAVSGATKYWIYRSTDGKNFKYYDSTTKTTYTNNSTTVGTRYYYKVKAVVVDNGTSYASAFSSAKSMTVRAAAPTLKTSAPEGTPSLSWNAVNGATKYWIYRSTDGKEFKYYDSTTKTAYTNKSVDAGKTYYYKVKAVNVVNGTSYASGFSNSVSVLVK